MLAKHFLKKFRNIETCNDAILSFKNLSLGHITLLINVNVSKKKRQNFESALKLSKITNCRIEVEARKLQK
jgi:hypothetical protein